MRRATAPAAATSAGAKTGAHQTMYEVPESSHHVQASRRESLTLAAVQQTGRLKWPAQMIEATREKSAWNLHRPI